MSQVGAFPGTAASKRRTIRGPINPLDKSTVVSILPKEVDEVKATIQPGRFIIRPGTFENPAILIVGPSSWWRDIDEDQPLLEIPVSSIQIADSVVRDYCNGILGCDMDSRMPGMFYVPGCKYNAKNEPDAKLTLEWIKNEYKNALVAAREKQRAWYSVLVQIADSLWARSNGNPIAITEDMRLAARELGVQENKDWMTHFRQVSMERCYACGALKNPDYPVCGSCRAIDPSHPKAKDIKFAS